MLGEHARDELRSAVRPSGPQIFDASPNVDVYAQTRADIQTERTYGSIASNAMKWVPLLNVVLIPRNGETPAYVREVLRHWRF